MVEPIQAYFVLEFDYKTTAQAEGIAMISKTLSLFIFIKFHIFGVLVSFAIADLIDSTLCFCFSLLMAVMQYYYYFLFNNIFYIRKDPKFSLFPKKIKESKKEYYVHKGNKHLINIFKFF